MSIISIEKRDVYAYPTQRTFRPSYAYPEYKLEELSDKNEVYDMVRENFRRMGLDLENYGSKHWNPLGTIIKPGNKVLLKPNLVMDVNPTGEGTDCLFTHPSIVAATIDYVLIALQGVGEIIVGDAPMQECNFENLVEASGYKELLEYYSVKFPQIKFLLKDFRDLRTIIQEGVYHRSTSETSSGVVVDLASESEFSGEEQFDKMRITNYDPDILKSHHNCERHEYYVSKYILDADVIINIPKPKTHRKAGVTIALKNLVGINARKEYLPHHTNGSVQEGGDEYLNMSLLKSLKNVVQDSKNRVTQTKQNYFLGKILRNIDRAISIPIRAFSKDPYFEGSWYGNNTISKTIIDLNKIIFYADKNGIMQDKQQRGYFIIADMIISGEKEGPVLPSAKNVGIIAMGYNPVCFDEIIAKLMGAKIECIPTLTQARKSISRYKIVSDKYVAKCISNNTLWNDKTLEEIPEESLLYFEPTSGWKKVFYKKGEIY